VIRAILRYWVKCPDAKDTIEGIRKWWIPRGHAVGEEEVQKALEFLISKGWLTRRETTPSKTIYSINKDHLENIKRYLARS